MERRKGERRTPLIPRMFVPLPESMIQLMLRFISLKGTIWLVEKPSRSSKWSFSKSSFLVCLEPSKGLRTTWRLFLQPPLQGHKGLKPNNQDSKQASEAGNQQSGEEEKPKFSISNFGNSLFSKFTNIFSKEEAKQEPMIQQEQIQLPEPIEIKRPKYLCSCGEHPTTPYMCSQSFQWYSLHNKRARKNQTITSEEYLKLKNTYLNILSQRDENKETDNQINRDLLRTFPLHSYYQEGSKGIEKMRRVLTAYSQYDLQVDYVQGMNFIVGALLYHANEVMAFWLFVSLIEDCEMRDIYMNGLPGLFKHSHIISSLISTNMFELAEHFAEHNLKVEMYASDWIFGLFASVIPLEQMGSFFSQFFAPLYIFAQMDILLPAHTLNFEDPAKRASARRRTLEHPQPNQFSLVIVRKITSFAGS